MSDLLNRVRWFFLLPLLVAGTGLTTSFVTDKNARPQQPGRGVALAADTPVLVTEPLYSGSFSSLHEPSGVVRINDTTLVVIEDEMAHPLRRLNLEIDSPAGSFTIEEQAMATADSFIKRQLLGPLDDLEGIARVGEARFFAIGSHDDAIKKKQSLRQKLVLFTLDEDKITSVKARRDLYKDIRKSFPTLAARFKKAKKSPNNALNIEGLTFDRKRQQLHIGLRSPRLDANAVIITLLNPIAYVQTSEPARFVTEPWQLDLDKGGIRALTYDDISDKLLIISQRESGNTQQFKLWSVPADNSQPPTRIRTQSKKLFNRVEGLTAINNEFLFVKDNGLRSRRHGADWFVLHRQQLGVDE